MNLTITQNGGLFAAQHRPTQNQHRPSHKTRIADLPAPTSTLRTSVGAFAFRHTALGCHLDLLVGNSRWTLGLYGTNEAALQAVKNRRTGFRTWDALKRRTTAAQFGTLSRWTTGDRLPTQSHPPQQSPKRLSISKKHDAPQTKYWPDTIVTRT